MVSIYTYLDFVLFSSERLHRSSAFLPLMENVLNKNGLIV